MKFNGESEKEYKTYKENFMKKFEITKLPPYLILYIKVSKTFLSECFLGIAMRPATSDQLSLPTCQ